MYIIPKSLKFSHWPGKINKKDLVGLQPGYGPLILIVLDI